ncbi:MAG: S41 family peptidase [Planctomycetota bacterium]
MDRKGYYLHPTIRGDVIVFSSDDDLWSVPAEGGLARRLTRSRGIATRPRFSPDGSRIAYIGVEEGYPEVYVMDSDGGEGSRLTRVAAPTLVLGWTPDGKSVVFATIGGRSTRRLFFVHTVPAEGGPAVLLPVGPAVALDFGPEKGVVIGRGSGLDPSWWKRYRGGRIGEIWIDREGGGDFSKLTETGGNLANPLWMGDRIYFHSDHEGVGNLYSCASDGKDLRRHTDHADFYVRSASGDGQRIVYAGGGDIHIFDPASDASRSVAIDFPSQRTQRARRFVPADRYFEGADVHPQGHSLCLTARGRLLTLGHWEEAVRHLGSPSNRIRYRLGRWFPDGKRVVAVSDEGGEEALEVYDENGARLRRYDGLDIGRPVTLQVSPTREELLLSNHRAELIHVDLEKASTKVLAQSRYSRIQGHDFSPDGRYVAYGFSDSRKKTAVMLTDLESGGTVQVVEPVLHDVAPSFDPDGKYLYFLSYSGFDPVRDVLDFAYGFPRGIQLKLVTLRADMVSPFIPTPRSPAGGPSKSEGKEGKEEPEGGEVEGGEKAEGRVEEKGKDGEKDKEDESARIDLDGIEKRVVLFPLPPGEYTQIEGLPGGKVLFTSLPVQGLIGRPWLPGEPDAKGTLKVFEFESGKEESIVHGITRFWLDGPRKVAAIQSGWKLRVLAAGQKPADESPGPPNRKNGWIDLTRPKISVDPLEEWKQMLAEGWRLLRDHYYIEDMGGCDWELVYRRYAPLVERASTRRELSDLFWEMGGELGTSHAYELGGDYLPTPHYTQGFLAADFEWRDGAWRIARIVNGDPGEPGQDSPLNGPGVNVEAGDALLAVNGLPLDEKTPPEERLVSQGNQNVALTFQSGEETRTVTVKALANDMAPRHREWVAGNTRRVHEETGGRVGYIHLSDMGAQGFSEFHRAYLTEVEYDGLIVDVRFNSGGHVSPLILSRLMRRQTGYSIGRWIDPHPRPPDAFGGPIVGITDEFSGSDGDSFSHNFKQLGIGPLIGKRTWGGIVGLNPTHPLVDGTVTTQPEYFNWYTDVGYGLENHGAEPDIVVEITPREYAEGRDPQLEKAIETALDLLEKHPPVRPDFGPRPDRSLPRLPERG